MKRIRGIILCLTFCLPILTGQIVILPATAYAQSSGRNFFISVDGTKQGTFKADPQKPKTQGSAISYEVKGGSPGRARAHILVITKEAGPSSPQFFTALFTNEVLKTVTLEFFRVSVNGAEEFYQTIKLTNATVSQMRQYTRQGDQQKNLTPLLEDITLSFQHIEIISVQGKTMAVDDLK
jgi:type VI secretion system secreted protein Hcp